MIGLIGKKAMAGELTAVNHACAKVRVVSISLPLAGRRWSNGPDEGQHQSAVSFQSAYEQIRNMALPLIRRFAPLSPRKWQGEGKTLLDSIHPLCTALIFAAKEYHS